MRRYARALAQIRARTVEESRYHSASSSQTRSPRMRPMEQQVRARNGRRTIDSSTRISTSTGGRVSLFWLTWPTTRIL